MRVLILFAALLLLVSPAQAADCANGQCKAAPRVRAAVAAPVNAAKCAAQKVKAERPRLLGRLLHRCR